MPQVGGRLIIGFSAAVFAIGALTSCGLLVARKVDTMRVQSHVGQTQAVASAPMGQVSLSAQTFNPAIDTLTISIHVGSLSQLEAFVMPPSGGAPVRSLGPTPAAGQVSLQWNGRDDHGSIVPPGAYRIQLRASDGSGRVGTAVSEPVAVTNKYILVSESRQLLYAYDGSSLFLRTPVTTGGPELPTPNGTFHVLDKTRNLYVYSPWPKGSPYWFPDVTYQYAMDFLDTPQYGLYIHDASWRQNYGPGSNAIDGTPGEDDTGSHGCINVPLEAQEQLYNWTPVNTPVIVRP